MTACGGKGKDAGTAEAAPAKEADAAASLLEALTGGDAATLEAALGGLDAAALAALTGGSASPGGDFTYDLNKAGDGIVINRYTGKGGVVIVPSAIEGYPVVALYEDEYGSGNVFYKTGVTSVILPAGITAIPAWTFNECKSLQTVILPDTVKSIGEWAFSDCTSLHTVVLPASLESIDELAFLGCTELYNLTIPDSITALKWPADGGTNNAFATSGKLKIATRKRLQELGYTGKF
jgi:hypothetical protein